MAVVSTHPHFSVLPRPTFGIFVFAGFTDRLYDPQECIYLPERFNIGMVRMSTFYRPERLLNFTLCSWHVDKPRIETDSRGTHTPSLLLATAQC